MERKVKCTVHNRFDIEVIRNGKVIKKAYAENILLDRIYTRLCGYSTYFVNILFGTGTGELSPARTTMFALAGYKTATLVTKVKAYPLSQITKQITIGETEYVGQILTEVGISDHATNINTHAFLMDENGEQTVIEKTNTDIVIIYATVFVTLQNKNSLTFFGLDESSSFNNTLLNYLLTETVTFSNVLYLNSLALKTNINNASTPTSNITLTKNVNTPNKKITYTGRVPIGNANFKIRQLNLKDILSFNIPDDVLPYINIENEILGAGDGVNKNFNTAFSDFFDVEVKIDDILNNDYQYIKQDFDYFLTKITEASLTSAYTYSYDYKFLFTFNGSVSGSDYKHEIDFLNGDKYYYLGVVSVGSYLRTNPASGFKDDIYYFKAGRDKSHYYSIDNFKINYLGTVAPTDIIFSTYQGTTDTNYPFITQGSNDIYFRKEENTGIEFINSPADGSVISASYKVPYIPKDTNHVLDVTMEIIFGEGVTP